MPQSYNDRLFNNKTIRSKLHYARYYWLEKKLMQYSPEYKSVIELGCYDGKTLNFLNQNISYTGYDANWEGGLDIAKSKNLANAKFISSETISEFNPDRIQYDISICMETLEHLPIIELDNYIKILHESTKQYCFITIPNEQGLILVAKYFTKKYIIRNVTEAYSIKDLYNGFIGRTDRIKRNEGGHKGFDYNNMIESLSSQFQLIEINGIPFQKLSAKMNFSIGIVLKKKD